MQSAFLKLWAAQMTFETERAAYAWIYKTCHNAGIDHLRAHATRFEAGVEPAILGEAAGESGDPVAERQWVQAKLARLDEREAQVLAYRAVDGMTQDEIAEVMGVSRKTIVRVCAAIEAKIAEGGDA